MAERRADEGPAQAGTWPDFRGAGPACRRGAARSSEPRSRTRDTQVLASRSAEEGAAVRVLRTGKTEHTLLLLQTLSFSPRLVNVTGRFLFRLWDLFDCATLSPSVW